MNLPDILIEVEDGTVTNVHAKDHKNTHIVVVDWDNIKAGDSDVLVDYPVDLLTQNEVKRIKTEAVKCQK